jgi:hypothetical protein
MTVKVVPCEDSNVSRFRDFTYATEAALLTMNFSTPGIGGFKLKTLEVPVVMKEIP